MTPKVAKIGFAALAIAAVWTLPAVAQEAAAAAEVVEETVAEGTPIDAAFMVNNLWIMLAGMLVFTMHLGFATLESGLTRSKNTVNILFKNTMIVCIGILTYALIGFNLMYPGFADDSAGFLEFGAISGFITSDTSDLSLFGPDYADYTWYTDFFFQAMFAATAATIVSGAVAGRIKLSSFLIWSTLFVGISYPITGAWKWGGGWLDGLGFYDFAGSTLVHAVGGTGALIMAILIGPRLGKFNADGSPNAIPGHNLTLAAIGVFLLWFGWFGFNGGSVLSADPALVSLVLVTTSMAAAAGGVVTGLVSWVAGGKPDLTMALNGVLAGLVGITAGADQMAVYEAVIIGAVAGIIVYFSVLFIEKIRIDDPVGAVSVHLVCGIWGTLAVGVFGDLAGGAQFVNQLIGCFSIIAFTAVFSLITGAAIKAALGLRVSDAEQVEGLDLGEHDMACYPDFQQTFVKSYHLREV
ncbi:MAG: ammonium transporter [Planctomycetota bacterium]|jgi:Amt family ammonium transporter